MSTDIKRIDPKAIPALFEKHGIVPMQGGCLFEKTNGETCGCVNTVLAAEAAGRHKAYKVARAVNEYTKLPRLAVLSQIDKDYAIGLAEGWDGRLIRFAGNRPAELAGVEDGQAAWQACWESLHPAPTQADRLAALGRHHSNSPFAMQKS